MKKIIASAVGLALVGGVAVTTASAVESQFGGYWRTRMFFQDNFAQPDSANSITDTRTRLYYTAKFNDDFKFVNRFEFNTAWGDNNGGDLGTDGKGNFRIKSSYVDFTLGMVNATVGLQGSVISRGFVFDDDYAGATVTADFGMVKVPVLYAAVSSEDTDNLNWDGGNADAVSFTTNGVPSAGFGDGNGDIHMLSIMPNFNIGDAFTVTPHATWATVTEQDTDIYWVGADVDMKFDMFSGWATGIYNGGSVDNGPGVAEDDISAFLVAAGADAGIVHGQGFYASGDDDPNDNDLESFVQVGGDGYGASYYWSEIMGLGIFDFSLDGKIGDKISNIWAVNAGVTFKPMDKLSLNFDAWYAQLAEEVNMAPAGAPAQMEDELGVELDAKVTYQLMDDLSADFVFAYLLAGDATGPEDVMEGGVRLSLKF